MTSTAIMFNGYYDIKTSSSVTPYLGAGIGFASVSIKDLKIDGTKVADDDDIVFAYQIGAGIVFDINPNTKLDLGYKYFATTDPSYSDVEGFPFDYQYSSHNLTVGLRFSF
jgi:opacity protein-like surface antigen